MNAPSEVGPTAPARVVRMRSMGPWLREIVLAPTTAQRPLQAGQFIRVHVPAYVMRRDQLADPTVPGSAIAYARLPAHIVSREACVRAYSPSLPSTACDGHWPVIVRLESGRVSPGPLGRASAWLFGRREGDTVQCTAPHGTFVLKPGSREKIFVGGGTGVAPLRAMVWERLQQNADERMHLWVGARREDEVPYLVDMLAMCDTHPRLSFHLVYSEADNGEQGPRWVHEAVYEGLLHPHGALAECEFYVCGPPPMVAAVRRLLTQIGIPDQQVAFDDFG